MTEISDWSPMIIYGDVTLIENMQNMALKNSTPTHAFVPASFHCKRRQSMFINKT